MITEFNKISTGRFWKWLSILLLFISFCTSLSFHTQIAKAADITSSISGISGTSPTAVDSAGNKADINDSSNWFDYESYTLTYNFKIKDGTKIQDGDTATVTLPKNTRLRNGDHFSIMSPDGKTKVGTFTPKPASDPSSGVDYGTITFTNYYTNHQNDMSGTISFPVTGEKTTGGGGTGTDNYIAKNGWGFGETGNVAKDKWPGDGNYYPLDSNGRYQVVAWDVGINESKKTLTNVKVTDTLDDTSSQQMLPKTMFITDVNGKLIPSNEYNITYLPNSSTPTSFTIIWNGTLNKAVNIEYMAKITNPLYRLTGQKISLTNSASISGNGQPGGGKISGNTTTANSTVTVGGSGQAGGTSLAIPVKKIWKNVPIM